MLFKTNRNIWHAYNLILPELKPTFHIPFHFIHESDNNHHWKLTNTICSPFVNVTSSLKKNNIFHVFLETANKEKPGNLKHPTFVFVT